ncbi:bifunctional glycosyltransferase/CDP-glycerol:glycerophosphate glycerophosphotransferase [Thermomonospora curvata]|uniref:CDP-glycerol:poly(Glycerophosphate)glycerophosph otransferase n=1 Tax=Thermomonospora curvata (strain ATCC 19995 / DSM 43183 / JCM 3096 / KCTC 9072 / NBRC 15933 / NCIMB 10081 / Henssen B9) TaxID=471852 RepID=D1A999_THECD|nr:CDP-glycerol glycerophosphotransferase family protein [Thermomonospora curvata]ACY96795.1 CDP-glycerol:poly(glycerophosphate)glycerophosph otransferase [Thermomonospora curvata DSM 43183]
MRPDVSVIVIAYNDAARLPRAVGSVLAQSLGPVETIIVDDGSTDGTGEVAEQLAAAHPGRVRALHLPRNSGGCGRPRNTGLAQARGAHVMFLDSDDVLDRHACLNLVAAAEETGADLVSGRCVRTRPDRPGDRGHAWYPWLYARRAVYESITQNPDLLYDTLSTNKCYRRDFLTACGLSFAEDVHYEDLLFSTQAYLAARRIALIPHRVYTWHWQQPRPDGGSISSRRAELRNFADRLEVHRRIDAVLRARGAADLKLHKDAKFVNHDLLLYLRELRGRDADYQRRFLELAAAYMAELDERVWQKANPMPAIAAFLLGRGDLEGALAAAEYGRGRVPELLTELTERHGRVYWGRLEGHPAHPVLDVTDLGIHTAPPSRVRPVCTLTRLRRCGPLVLMAGRVHNPLERIPPDAEVQLTVEFADRRRKGRVLSVPAEVTRRKGWLQWRACFLPSRVLRPWGFIDPVWDLWLRLSVNGERTALRPRPADETVLETELPARPRLTRLAGDRLVPLRTRQDRVAFRLTGRRLRHRLARRAVRWAAATRAGRRLWRRIRAAEQDVRRRLGSQKTKQAVYNRLLVRLPIRKGTAVFESRMGACYAGNPRYIYEELRRSGRPIRVVWSYAGSPRGFPRDARLVRRGSWAYHLALARAEFWVDDHGFPGGLRKRRGTTYLQTWHGSAFKRMGLDHPELKRAGRAEQARFARMTGRFDRFLVRSRHDVDTLARGLGVAPDRLLPVGYPRNDPLVNGGDPAELAALRRALGLAGRQVVLYAPTFRPGRGGKAAPLRLPFDPVRFARELGDTHVMLVRPHYLTRVSLPPEAKAAVRDVGHIPDVTPLLLLADALVTDYSSIMFDYALLDRPMIFYVPDLEEYTGRDRGCYFDLAEHAPGPLLREEDALLAALADLPAQRDAHAARRRAFAARFGEYDRGDAAARVVELIFGGGDRDRT